jgi:hypothetical protein
VAELLAAVYEQSAALHRRHPQPAGLCDLHAGVNAGVGEQSIAGFGGRGKEVLIDGALSSFPDPAAPIPIWLV